MFNQVGVLRDQKFQSGIEDRGPGVFNRDEYVRTFPAKDKGYYKVMFSLIKDAEVTFFAALFTGSYG